MHKNYEEMTANAKEVADYIDNELSNFSKEDVRESEAYREYVVRTVLIVMGTSNPKLTPDEQQSVRDYVEAEFGVHM